MADHWDGEERRRRPRSEDDPVSPEEFARREDLLACVKRDELEKIIKDAVTEALDSYEHKCRINVKDEDLAYVQEFFNSLREIGDGDMRRAAVMVRENHKFVTSLHGAALKVGWGVIIVSISIMGALGLFAAGVWKNGGGS